MFCVTRVLASRTERLIPVSDGYPQVAWISPRVCIQYKAGSVIALHKLSESPLLFQFFLFFQKAHKWYQLFCYKRKHRHSVAPRCSIPCFWICTCYVSPKYYRLYMLNCLCKLIFLKFFSIATGASWLLRMDVSWNLVCNCWDVIIARFHV